MAHVSCSVEGSYSVTYEVSEKFSPFLLLHNTDKQGYENTYTKNDI